MIEAMLMGGGIGMKLKSTQRVLLNNVGSTYGVGTHQVPIKTIDSSISIISGLQCNTQNTTTDNYGPILKSLEDNYFEFEVFNSLSGQGVYFDILELSGISEVRRGYYPPETRSVSDALGPISDPGEVFVLADAMGNWIPPAGASGPVAAAQYIQIVSVDSDGVDLVLGTRSPGYLLQVVIL